MKMHGSEMLELHLQELCDELRGMQRRGDPYFLLTLLSTIGRLCSFLDSTAPADPGVH